MNKINYIIIVFLSVIFILPGCDDFLDTKPKMGLTEGNVLQNANDAESFITSCYDGLQKGFDEYYVWDWMIYGDAMADNAYSGGDDPDIIQIDKFLVSAANSVVLRDWKSIYGGIMRCNTALQNVPLIPDASLDEIGSYGVSRREQILGEARFLRAFHYFNLVKMWGDVPLVTSTGSLSPNQIYLPQSPQNDVYTQIYNDLAFAESRLPKRWSNNSETAGRATWGMVHALFAKAYATQGSPNNVNWEKVKFHCNEVINSGVYSLLDNYDHLFDDAHRNNSESVFAVQYLASSQESNYAPQLLLPPSLTGDNWRKYITPSQDLIKAFDDEGDVVRKNATIISEDINNMWTDEYYAQNQSGNWVTNVLPFPYKMRHANGWQSGDLIYFIRLADLVLLKAEAVNETDGYTIAANDVLLQKIRTRVGLSPLNPSSASNMRLLLEKERRLELAFEGHRWFDLKRTGRAMDVMNAITLEVLVNNKKENKRYDVLPYMLLLPIPQGDRDRNPNLGQNPNY